MGITQSDVYVRLSVGKFPFGVGGLEKASPSSFFLAVKFPSCLDGVLHATLSLLVMVMVVVVTFGFVGALGEHVLGAEFLRGIMFRSLGLVADVGHYLASPN